MSLTVAFVYMIDNSTAVYVATRGVTDKVDFFGHLSICKFWLKNIRN